NQGDPVRDLFIVFPHLTPFADTTKLVAAERNDSLYRTPRAYLATQGPPSVFALKLHADATASADRSVLSLNSFQIREGSERIYVRNTLLTRETDYTIDYTTGQVQFKNADSLFRGGAAQVRAQFEERAAFSLAPTTIRGAEPLGVTGAFDPNDAAFLTWQSLPYNVSGNQFVPVQFLPQQIDPTLRFTGQAQAAEPVLWLMMKPDTVLGLANNRPESPSFGLPNWTRPTHDAPRWRSIVQTLSATGVDLSRVEFLEFWVWEDAARVARAHRTTVLFDFGSVFEDALAFVPASFTVSPEGDTT